MYGVRFGLRFFYALFSRISERPFQRLPGGVSDPAGSHAQTLEERGIQRGRVDGRRLGAVVTTLSLLPCRPFATPDASRRPRGLMRGMPVGVKMAAENNLGVLYLDIVGQQVQRRRPAGVELRVGRGQQLRVPHHHVAPRNYRDWDR